MEMMKKSMKLVSFFMIVIMILMVTSAFAYGGNPDSSAYWQKAKDDAVAASSGPKEADQAIQERATPILNAYIWFGYAISLGMVVFIGIKYMLGAADARASMKSAMVGWLIGALVVFMATTIVGWVINIAIPDKDGSADGLANEIVQNGWDLGN